MFFFYNFKDCHCFCQEHLEGRQKEQRSNSSKNELIPNNRKVMYQGNTYVVLGKFEMLDAEYAGRKTHTKEEQVSARNPNDVTLPDEMNDEAV